MKIGMISMHEHPMQILGEMILQDCDDQGGAVGMQSVLVTAGRVRWWGCASIQH